MEKCRFKPSDSPVLNDGVTASVFGQGELLRGTCSARKARSSPAIGKHTWLVSMESDIINSHGRSVQRFGLCHLNIFKKLSWITAHRRFTEQYISEQSGTIKTDLKYSF